MTQKILKLIFGFQIQLVIFKKIMFNVPFSVFVKSIFMVTSSSLITLLVYFKSCKLWPKDHVWFTTCFMIKYSWNAATHNYMFFILEYFSLPSGARSNSFYSDCMTRKPDNLVIMEISQAPIYFQVDNHIISVSDEQWINYRFHINLWFINITIWNQESILEKLRNERGFK